MKYTLTVLFLLTWVSVTFSQNNPKLDNKYGFKHFVLNTAPYKYKKEITKITSSDPNSKITEYEYIGGKINDLFGVSITNITLTYYEDKLENIQILFGDIGKEFTQNEYNKILYSLQQLYGEGNSLNVSDEDFVLYGGRKWLGQKVTMEVLRLYYKPSERISGYIAITENNLHEKRIRDEF